MEFSVPPGNVRTSTPNLTYLEITVFPNFCNLYENHHVRIVIRVTLFLYLRRNYCNFPNDLIFMIIIIFMTLNFFGKYL